MSDQAMFDRVFSPGNDLTFGEALHLLSLLLRISSGVGLSRAERRAFQRSLRRRKTVVHQGRVTWAF